ncbi:hypothetical protein ACOILA_002467 [Cronobacter sakazakii]|uniref:hypothetical protein n=1 Tax=Cronobacter sakazakii TaxID=28141 RepID=UPI001375CB9E|nr:hypothetical protein [Cronobacter sakazakii]ELY2674508.1 hypothetical protein [Cronobacter sakazakii]ELY2749711.1 hypothetical protein [Cronobacter sakazakii]ELY2905279.1 hypothetical protein [Cronobacter sakazakii]ELY4586969.1 hypothetical protein [Cronobacter sakazakii]ELY4849181.1 hypothetical protein [Cronobacter sakazakii]
MNEPNYEYIGRCTVLKRRIEKKVDDLWRVKAAIIQSESSHFVNGLLELNYSAADRIEEAAEKYRALLHEIETLAFEHNEYATKAHVELIALQANASDLVLSETVQADRHATENA